MDSECIYRKNTVTQVSDESTPDGTPETSLASPVSNDNITQSSENVNHKTKQLYNNQYHYNYKYYKEGIRKYKSLCFYKNKNTSLIVFQEIIVLL